MKPIFVLVGPTCSGKTFLAERCGRRRLITCTTRNPRRGETNGVDYHFLTREEFDSQEMLCATKIIGCSYGIRPADIAQAEVAILDPAGLAPFEQACQSLKRKVYFIFVSCSRDIRYARALERGDDPAVVERRFAHDDYDFDRIPGIAHYTIHMDKGGDDPVYRLTRYMSEIEGARA